MKSAQLFALLFIFSFYLNSYAQNGWTKKAKSIYVQGVLSTFSSKNYYSSTNNLLNNGSTFNSTGLIVYGEYGIHDRLNLILDAPLIMFNNFSSTKTVAGVGNIKLGLKYRFFKEFPLALQVDLDIPTDDGINLAQSKQPNGLGTYDWINLPTSDGEFNVWTTLAASQSTKSGNTFASLYTGLNIRTKGFSHQIQAGFEIGHLFWKKWYVIGKMKILERLGNGTGATGSFLYGEGSTFTQYSITNIVKLNEHVSLVVGATDAIGIPVKRRNIYDGFNFFLGVSFEY